MLYISNCRNGMVVNNGHVRCINGVFVNGVSDLAIGINNTSYLESIGGPSGATIGITITDTYRGIAVGHNSSANISNGWIQAVSYGVAAFDASSLRFDNSSIIGSSIGSTTQPASIVGAYLDGGSNGSFLNTLVSGYTGGTGGATSASYQCINYSTLVHGSTTQASLVNKTTRYGNISESTVVIGGTASSQESMIPEVRIGTFNGR